MLKIIHLNEIAIIIATLVGVVLGIIWYSPIMFRKILLDDLARNNNNVDFFFNDTKKFYLPFIISVFGMAILAIILDTFLFFSKLAGMESFYAATLIGVTISVGIIALNMLSDYMISGTHIKFFTVHAGYRIVMTILMAWTLSFWR